MTKYCKCGHMKGDHVKINSWGIMPCKICERTNAKTCIRFNQQKYKKIDNLLVRCHS